VSKVVEDACEMFTERDMMKKSELQRFCSMDGFRQTIQEPWLVGGKTLATDGRILIIVNEEVAGVSQNTDAPSAQKPAFRRQNIPSATRDRPYTIHPVMK